MQCQKCTFPPSGLNLCTLNWLSKLYAMIWIIAIIRSFCNCMEYFGNYMDRIFNYMDYIVSINGLYVMLFASQIIHIIHMIIINPYNRKYYPYNHQNNPYNKKRTERSISSKELEFISTKDGSNTMLTFISS